MFWAIHARANSASTLTQVHANINIAPRGAKLRGHKTHNSRCAAAGCNVAQAGGASHAQQRPLYMRTIRTTHMRGKSRDQDNTSLDRDPLNHGRCVHLNTPLAGHRSKPQPLRFCLEQGSQATDRGYITIQKQALCQHRLCGRHAPGRISVAAPAQQQRCSSRSLSARRKASGAERMAICATSCAATTINRRRCAPLARTFANRHLAVLGCRGRSLG